MPRAEGGGTHVFGARDRAINITLDGIDANEPPTQRHLLAIRTKPDSLGIPHRELEPVGEMGRNSGAQVAMVTQSARTSSTATSLVSPQTRLERQRVGVESHGHPAPLQPA